MTKHVEIYDNLENILGKLYVLRDSCTGIRQIDASDPNLIWFQGAKSILQEVLDGLHSTLGAFEAGELGPAKTSAKVKPAPEQAPANEAESDAA